MMLEINVDKIAQEIISGLKATMNEKGRTATGQSNASLYAEFDEGNMILSIMGGEQWQYINRGRPAGGEKPPYSRILEWCIAKGIPQEAAWAIRTNIAKYGSPRQLDSTAIDESKLNVIEDTMTEVEPFILRELDKQVEASFEATIGKKWQSL
jgi:hypothetical protein